MRGTSRTTTKNNRDASVVVSIRHSCTGMLLNKTTLFPLLLVPRRTIIYCLCSHWQQIIFSLAYFLLTVSSRCVEGQFIGRFYQTCIAGFVFSHSVSSTLFANNFTRRRGVRVIATAAQCSAGFIIFAAGRRLWIWRRATLETGR